VPADEAGEQKEPQVAAVKTRTQDLRRTTRYVCSDQVEIIWTDERGASQHALGRCKDISSNGMRITAMDSPPLLSYLSFRLRPARFSGSASVRSVKRTFGGTEIGLEFTGGLEFNAARLPSLKVAGPAKVEPPTGD
jgi:hypothetical protein